MLEKLRFVSGSEPDPTYWQEVSDLKSLQWERDGLKFTAIPRSPECFDRVSAVNSEGVRFVWRSQDVYRGLEGEIAFARIGLSGLKELMIGPGVAANPSTPEMINELAS